MFLLLRMRLNAGRILKCRVIHERGTAPGDSEVIEESEIVDPRGSEERERGCVVPCNPREGDRLVFDLVEVAPLGPEGAAYEWDVTLCDFNGPARGIPDPRVFRVEVPRQTAPDLAACPEARIEVRRAVKAGERTFVWTVDSEALAA